MVVRDLCLTDQCMEGGFAERLTGTARLFVVHDGILAEGETKRKVTVGS